MYNLITHIHQLALGATMLNQSFDPRSSKICLCGHPSSSHEQIQNKERCMHHGLRCKCTMNFPVISVREIGAFHFTTTGAGADHALSKGIKRYREKNSIPTWHMGEFYCMGCFKMDIPRNPVSMNENGSFLINSGPYNALVCDKCLVQIVHDFSIRSDFYLRKHYLKIQQYKREGLLGNSTEYPVEE